MHGEGWDFWGKEIPGFAEFWAFLGDLVEWAEQCSCRAGTCGPDFCAIRKCARERRADVCVL